MYLFYTKKKKKKKKKEKSEIAQNSYMYDICVGRYTLRWQTRQTRSKSSPPSLTVYCVFEKHALQHYCIL